MVVQCGVRPVCRLHFGQTFHFLTQFYSKKCPPQSVVETVPKMHFLFSSNLLLLTKKEHKMLFQLEKVGNKRLQTGLKAAICHNRSLILTVPFNQKL